MGRKTLKEIIRTHGITEIGIRLPAEVSRYFDKIRRTMRSSHINGGEEQFVREIESKFLIKNEEYDRR